MGATRFVCFALCVAFVSAVDFPLLNQKPREVFFKLNEPVKLDCGDFGDARKDVKYTWKKDGKPLTLDKTIVVLENKQDTLIFLNPTQSSEGLYQCFAESAAGVSTSGIYSLKRTFLDVTYVKPQIHNPIEGEPYKLDCPIPPAYPKPNITWVLQHPFESLLSFTVLDPRITIGPDNALYFSNITEDDVDQTFTYACLASTPASVQPVRLSMHFIYGLKKNEKPAKKLVPQYLSPNKVVVQGGGTAILYCIYGGTPLASPDWFLNGKNINGNGQDRVTAHNRSKGRRLFIRYSSPGDSGTYSCVVTDVDGSKKTHTMALEVNESPIFKTSFEIVTKVKEGKEAVLSCAFTSKPTAKLTWTYNGKPLTEGGKIKLVTSNSGIQTTSKLHISNFQKSDQGYYRCAAQNGDAKDGAAQETLVRVE